MVKLSNFTCVVLFISVKNNLPWMVHLDSLYTCSNCLTSVYKYLACPPTPTVSLYTHHKLTPDLAPWICSSGQLAKIHIFVVIGHSEIYLCSLVGPHSKLIFLELFCRVVGTFAFGSKRRGFFVQKVQRICSETP